MVGAMCLILSRHESCAKFGGKYLDLMHQNSSRFLIPWYFICTAVACADVAGLRYVHTVKISWLARNN